MKTYRRRDDGAAVDGQAVQVLILRPGRLCVGRCAPVIWEHGRRNFGLRDDGVLAVVLPVRDDSDVCGVGVFAGSSRDHRIMAAIPRAGWRNHLRGPPCVGFPGDTLP